MGRPVIGICAALEQARWSVWDDQAFLTPRSYVDAVHRAGGLALLIPPDPQLERDPDELLDLLDGADPRRRRRHRPGQLRRRAPREDRRHRHRARHVRDRPRPPRARARRAAAGHLPRDAADERRRRAGRSTSTSPTPTATRITAARSARSTAPTTTSAWSPGRWPRRPPARSTTGPSRTITRASSDLGDGLKITGWAELDDLPEAIEAPGKRFALGVQWHPEADEVSPIIESFVREAAQTTVR